MSLSSIGKTLLYHTFFMNTFSYISAMFVSGLKIVVCINNPAAGGHHGIGDAKPGPSLEPIPTTGEHHV
jgi:hypothetical protein